MRTTLVVICLILVSLSGLYADQDDNFSHLPGLEVFRIADKEMELYKYESAAYQYRRILNELPVQQYLPRIYGLSKMAKVFHKMHHYSDAWTTILEAEALAINHLPDDHPVLGFLYHQKGELAGLTNRFSEAKTSLTTSIAIRSRLYGEEACMTAYSIKELGELYLHYMGDNYQVAEPLIRQSFEILDQCIEGPSYQKGMVFYDLGLIYLKRGEDLKARELFEASLDIHLSCDAINWDFIPYCYQRLSYVEYLQKNWQISVQYALKALDIREQYKTGNIRADIEAYKIVSDRMLSASEPEQANAFLQKGLSMYETTGLDDPKLYWQLLLEYGRLGAQIGNREQFYTSFHKGRKVQSEMYPDGHLQLAVSSRRMAYLAYHYFADADSAQLYFDKAVECLNESLAGAGRSSGKLYYYQELADVHYYKASMLYELAQRSDSLLLYQAAFRHYIKSDSTLGRLKAGSDWTSSKLNYGEYYKVVNDEALECAAAIQKLNPDLTNALYPHVFRLMESYKSYLLFESINDNMELKRRDLPDSIRETYEQVFEEIRMLEIDSFKTDKKLARLESLKLQRNAIMQSVEGRSYTSNIDRYTRNLFHLETCQDALTDSECLVEYYWSGEQYFQLYLSNDTVAFSPIGRLDSLESVLQLIYHMKGAANYNSTVLRFERLANELYHQLFPIQPDRKTIVIVPDGKLNYLPFETLTISVSRTKKYRDLDYLLRDHLVCYAYSATQHLRIRALENPEAKGIFALFPRVDLGNAEREKAYLDKSFRRVLFSKNDESKHSLLSNFQNRAIVHVATHGHADVDRANSNYLELNMGQRLYDYEIGSSGIHSNLVFLNACETNIGKEYIGEGVFSLSKSFMEAGCPSVISSIWKIPDAAAANISIEFYRQLRQDGRLLPSFNAAKLKYLETAPELACHPYYWSGLLLIGSDMELSLQPTITTWKIALAVATVCVLLILISYYVRCTRQARRIRRSE